MAHYVIGVDLGTGSTKSLAIDDEGRMIASAQVHYPTLNPLPGYCEQDAGLVWQAFIKCVGSVTAKLSSPPAAVILSSAMHSIIPVDRNGHALTNMIIWTDNRSGAIARKMKESFAGEMLYEQTGTPIHAMTPLCKLIWLKENREDLFTSAHKFISIKEYIWFRLFRDFQVDYSLASATGLMDIATMTWNGNALDFSSVEKERLSALVAPDFSRTDFDPVTGARMGLGQDTRIIMGASDGCLANLGSFATEPGIAALTIGTSGAVRVASRKPVHHFESMTFNYRLDRETFICGGPTNNGGAALKWFIGNFLQQPLETADDYDAVLRTISTSKPGADGLIFLPYLFGERAPIWNSDASALFFGITAAHTHASFTRAVVEGISMALYDIADHMMQGGLPITRIHVSGGFVRSSAWLQILASLFNRKVCLLSADDASAIGAAYLGLKSIGLIEEYSVLKPAVIQEFLPEADATHLYQGHFARYRELYRSLRHLMVS